MYRKLLIIIVVLLSLFFVGCTRADKTVSKDNDEVIVFMNTSAQPTGATEDSMESSYKEYRSTEAVTYADAGSNSFTEDLNYDVKSFIRQYYDYLAAGDYELAAYMTNDSSRMSRDKFIKRSEYIESIKSLSCYMMEGIIDGTYIVVARCAVQTSLGAQVVSFLEAFYVCTNESGTFYICGSGVGDEVMSYNSIMLSDQMITDALEDVKEDNAKAVKEQENLVNVYQIVYSDEVFRYLYEQPLCR